LRKPIISLTAFALLFGAGACVAQDTLWTRFLDLGDNTQIVSARCQGTDLFLGGAFLPTGSSNGLTYAARYSGTGDSLWVATSGLDTFEMGGELVVGPDLSPYLWVRPGESQHGVLVKFDADGETLWSKVCPGIPSAVLAADTLSNCYLFGARGDSLWFGRFDVSGNQTLDKTLSLGPSHETGPACIASDQGLVAGASIFDTTMTAVLVRLSGSGDTLWTRQYSESLAVFFAALAPGPVNTVYAVGTDVTGLKLLKFDSGGDTVWTTVLPQSGLATDVAVDASGNCYVAYSGKQDDFNLDKYGPDGEFLGTGHAAMPDIETPASVTLGSDGFPVVAGVAVDTSAGNFTQGFIVKFSGTPGWVLEPEVKRPAGPWRLVGTVSDGTRLDWQIGAAGEYRFSVFDPVGRYKCGRRAEFAAGRHSLALPGLCAGVYLVRIETDGAVHTGKFVVRK